MEARVHVLTLGVDDLDRAFAFYHEGLGWASQGIIGKEFEFGAVAFFELQVGLKLALWPRKSIAHDAGLVEGERSATEMTLGHNVGSRAAVDEVMQRARLAGAVVVREGNETFWGGYSGYFQDLDGHLWEVVWNPNFANL